MDPAGLRPLGIGETIDVALKIYRARFTVLIKAVTVMLAPVFVLSAVIRISVGTGDGILAVPTQPGATPEFDTDRLWAFVAGGLVIGILAFLAAQIATGACFKAVSGAYLDEETDWRGSLRFAASRFGSLLWLSVLLFVFLVPALLACIVPGAYLYVAWSVAAPVLLLEGVKGRKALKRSRALVKGRFWQTLSTVVLMGILSAIVQSVFVGIFAGLASVGGNEVASAIAEAIGQTASSALTTPLTAAVLTVMYFDLRVRKEGFDIELLARRMGVDPETPVGGAEAIGEPPWPRHEEPPSPPPDASPNGG